MSQGGIPRGSLLLLDTVTLIYFLESHPRYGPFAETVFARVEAGEIKAIMSSLVFAELLVPLYQDQQNKTADALMRRLRGFRNLTVQDVTPRISAEAARLRAVYGLRTPDALHAATGITNRADALLTNDRGLLRLERELKVWLFDNLVDGP